MNFEPLETRTFLSMSPAVALMQPHVSVEPHPQVRMSSTSISYVGAGIGQSQQPNVTSNSFSIPIIGITAVRGSIVYITIERINLPRISLPPGNFDYPHMIDSHQGWPQPGQWAPPPPPPGPVVTPP